MSFRVKLPRRFRFSLRALMVAVALCALLMVLVAAPRIQRSRNVQWMRKNCAALFALSCDEPNLLDRLLGLDDGNVISANFSGLDKEVTPECLGRLHSFGSIEYLYFSFVSIEPGSALFPTVTENIHINSVTGDSLGQTLDKMLAQQTNLSSIEVYDAPAFTDSHVSRLAGSNGLQKISLQSVAVTGEGFKEFAAHKGAIELSIGDCGISAKGLRCILQCPAIRTLSLEFNSSAVEGLDVLKEIDPTKDIYLSIRVTSDERLNPETIKLLNDLKQQRPTFDWVKVEER